MSDQFVVFAIPAFEHSIVLGGVQSLIEAEWMLTQENIPRGYVLIGGDPYLPKVRNLCVARAMRMYPQMTDFFFIDADVTWPAAAALRLIKRPEDVVCGVYPKKSDNVEFPVFLDCNEGPDGIAEYIVKDGLYKAKVVPTGFLRIKRHVLDRMAGSSPKYIDGTGGNELVSNLFEAMYRPFAEKVDPKRGDGDFWGEDYDWSRKWHDFGGDMWVDPDIDFGHTGKKTWRGNLKTQGIEPSIRDGKARMPSAPLIEAHEADFEIAKPEWLKEAEFSNKMQALVGQAAE